MTDFTHPQAVDDITLAFPASVAHLMPVYADIPKKFRNGHTIWNQFQSDWFYGGIEVTGLIAKPGIDRTRALRHLSAINHSFEPKHEHKEAAVAYLASLWFEETSTWTRTKGI